MSDGGGASGTCFNWTLWSSSEEDAFCRTKSVKYIPIYRVCFRFSLTKHDDYFKSLLTIFKASSVKNWHELITKPQQRKFNQICETLCTHTDDLCYSQPSHSVNFSACGTAQLFGMK